MVDPQKWGVIYNPKAGTRKVKKRWKEIKEYMDANGVSYDYMQSEGFGSVERLAGILANNGYKTIVIVGGDGALNDAVNGILNSEVVNKDEIGIGIIPNGIGNYFAQYWGMDMDYRKAVDTIIKNRRRKIDVGYCKYYDGERHQKRFFINAINIGFGARIAKVTDRCKRFWGSKTISYIASFFLLFFERNTYRMHLCINGEHVRGRIMSVCIGNTDAFGQTPSAVPYNGWLDVSIIYRPQLMQTMLGLWLLIQGRILNHKQVKSFRTRKVQVLRARNAPVDADGRLMPKKFPLKISIIQEKLTLIIP